MAIHYFKEVSCFDSQYAKNNLGVIYKTGTGVVANPSGSIVYFEEAIRQKEDPMAMFNLAHIYFFEEAGFFKLSEAIKLLIKSAIHDVPESTDLLCLAVVKKFKPLNKKEVIKEFESVDKQSGSSLALIVIEKIEKHQLTEELCYEQLYFHLKEINLVYYGCNIENQTVKKKIENIDLRPQNNSTFYEGLGDI